jgi:hypothetical protein
MINPASLETFMTVYARHLAACVRELPDEYAWPIENLPLVLGRMRPALESGSYCHDSHAFRRTCKALGIKHTRKAISAFLSGAEDGAA